MSRIKITVIQCTVLRLGRTRYQAGLEKQMEYLGQVRADKTKGFLLLTEHEPVITVGKSGGADDLLVSEAMLRQRGVERFEVERGGRATLHAPGQLVAYPILPLQTLGISIREHLFRLEETLIALLQRLGLNGARDPQYTGAWVEGKKVAAIGVGAKSWVTFHGIALNLNIDMSLFRLLVPCGIADKPVTRIEDLLAPKPCPTLPEIETLFLEEFARIFQVQIET